MRERLPVAGPGAASPREAPQRAGRLQGLDVARALAIFGMVVVNVEVSLGGAERDPGLLADLSALLRGRAAATFVVLAGVGISLLGERARLQGGPRDRRRVRRLLAARGAFLFGLGLALMAVGWWPDILHFYGFYLAFAAWLFDAAARTLRRAAFVCVALFYAALPLYERGWVEGSLEYADVWTPLGFAHNTFLNGLHPVFPWFVFIVWGLWLGRQDLRDRRVLRRMVLGGCGVAVATELACGALEPWAGPELAPLVATDMLPPGLPYLLAAGGAATALIGACSWATQRVPNARLWAALGPFGRHALTWYVGHVLLLIFPLVAAGADTHGGIKLVWGVALAFSAATMAASGIWARRHARGPLSALMRRVTG
ncbi:MAG: DUF418 domain-containing protein [Myxococcota bacterium]